MFLFFISYLIILFLITFVFVTSVMSCRYRTISFINVIFCIILYIHNYKTLPLKEKQEAIIFFVYYWYTSTLFDENRPAISPFVANKWRLLFYFFRKISKWYLFDILFDDIRNKCFASFFYLEQFFFLFLMLILIHIWHVQYGRWQFISLSCYNIISYIISNII